MLYFEVEDPEKYPLVQLLNTKCCVELINKPEKILKVYVEN
jgi:dTDP-glucose pyrophosphorylase